jgi:hypothetical protein
MPDVCGGETAVINVAKKIGKDISQACGAELDCARNKT